MTFNQLEQLRSLLFRIAKETRFLEQEEEREEINALVNKALDVLKDVVIEEN